MGGARVGRDLFKNEHVPAVLLEAHRVRFHVAQNPVEIVLVDAQELAAVLPRDDRGRPLNDNKAR